MVKQNARVIFCLYFVSSAFGFCPQRWIDFENSCYFFGGKMLLTYYEAQAFCGTMRGHVININGSSENAFAKSYARLGSNSLWIGTTREIDQVTWLWFPSLSPVTFHDWDNGQPDGKTGEQDCAFLYKPRNYKWHDFPCRDLNGGKFLVLCEKPKASANPLRPDRVGNNSFKFVFN